MVMMQKSTKEWVLAPQKVAEEVVGSDANGVDDAGLNDNGVRLRRGQSLQLGVTNGGYPAWGRWWDCS